MTWLRKQEKRGQFCRVLWKKDNKKTTFCLTAAAAALEKNGVALLKHKKPAHQQTAEFIDQTSL